MILSGKRIQQLLGKEIVIDPYLPELVNPNSYNLRLHNELFVYKNATLDMKKDNAHRKVIIPKEGLVLEPQKLYLGRTVEYTETHSFVPMLEGRSSIARLGMFIHVSAGFGDVGFAGHWTLEMFCVHPVKVYPFVSVCQIFYHTIEGDWEPYRSKYQKNSDIQTSRLYEELQRP